MSQGLQYSLVYLLLNVLRVFSKLVPKMGQYHKIDPTSVNEMYFKNQKYSMKYPFSNLMWVFENFQYESPKFRFRYVDRIIEKIGMITVNSIYASGLKSLALIPF